MSSPHCLQAEAGACGYLRHCFLTKSFCKQAVDKEKKLSSSLLELSVPQLDVRADIRSGKWKWTAKTSIAKLTLITCLMWNIMVDLIFQS